MAKGVKKSAKKSPKKAVRKASKKATRKAARKTAKTAKKTPKESAKRTPVKTQKDKDSQALPIIGVIALVVIAIALIYTGVSGLFSQEEAPVIAATVNGVEITTTQLETQYAILPEQYRAIYTPELILQQLIDEELLIAYGREQGHDVTGEDVNEEIQRVLGTGELTITELQENLDGFNLTIEDFEALIERKLLIELSMASLQKGKVPVTEEDARAYYDVNNAQFVVEDQVSVRHILIASQRDNAAQFSKDLMESAKGGADFCQLVEEETDDKGSAANCGEYTFPRGMMVPEFEKASFELSPGEMTIVQTPFGYHIIEKLADVPGGVTPFEDAEPAITARLEQEATIAVYQEFLTQAKVEGDVQIFYTG